MYWDVVKVKHEEHLVLRVEFIDGVNGYVKFLQDHLTGVFEVLKDPVFFKQVFINNGAVSWPGEIDLAPDAMHKAIKKDGEWILS